MRKTLILLILIGFSQIVFAKATIIPRFQLKKNQLLKHHDFARYWADSKEEKYRDWFNLDLEFDGVIGVSSDRLYQMIEIPYRKEDIIVAVIDSGVDIHHEDLKGKIWINEKEIPNNGIDDDGNGYIDDIYGWNYLGNKYGDNINHANLELTRLVRFYSEKKELSSTEEAELKKLQKKLSLKLREAQDSLEYYEIVNNQEGVKYFQEMVDFYYNINFNPRDAIGQKDPSLMEVGYGNNDVIGPDADHGTHVAGIIAAHRKNEIGIKGVANRVKIMALRAVPNGDEHDIDIAHAIRYAVDNGAKIINMSFGKSYSLYKEEVHQAILYAHTHGVLVFHAAGNDGENNDYNPSYPNKFIDQKTFLPNFIEVGASESRSDIHTVNGSRHSLIASFSNYGPRSVDLFAPGHNIYSTITNNEYDQYSGTSMASPVAVGVAALIWSIKPRVTATELKKSLLQSVRDFKNTDVILPGTTNTKVKFKVLSQTGGVINALNTAKKLEILP